MPRVDPIQPAFNAGEFGPAMLARSDFDKYRAALRKCENMIALPQGGARRRPGTRFVLEAKDSSAKAELIPFEFSTEQAYMIVAENLGFRFCRNQGIISTQNITASITNGAFGSGITNWTDQSGAGSSIAHDATNSRMSLTSNGTTNAHAEQQVTNALAVEHVLQFRVYGAPGDKIKLRIGTSSTGAEIVNDKELGVGFYAYAFTATAADFYVQFLHDTGKTLGIDDVALIDNSPVELVTPYTTAQLPNVRWAQSADVLYLGHSAHPVYKLLRFGHASWGLEEVEWLDGPYLAENATTTTMDPGATTGLGISLLASSTVGVNGGEGFQPTDVGRLFRYSDGTNIGYGVITSVTDTLNAVIDVRDDFPVHTAKTTWRLGAWSGTTGYPQVIHFHEQRLCLANTTNDPDKYWLSQTGDFENMRIDSEKSGGGVEVQDDDALDYRISSDQVNAIQWVRSGRQLTIGTRGGEWVAQADGPIITPTDIDTKQQTSTGSSFINPVQVDNAVLFAQRGKREIREFAFNFEADGFRSPDMTILADHITRGRVCRMLYAASPDSQVCCVREDGRLAVLTYKREQDVIGWGRWVLGGEFSGGIAVAETAAVIPGNDGAGQVRDSTERDEIWVSVKRTINGVTKRYIEVFEESFEGPDRNDYLTEASYETALLAAQKNAYYCDSCITYDGVSTTTITGLGHLEGQTVKVLADGAVHPDKTVSSGQITLDQAASVVQVGLGYFHDMEPMKMDFGNPAGSALGKDKRVRETTLILHECGSLKIGSGRDDLKTISLREVADLMDTAVPLFSGERKVEIEGPYIPDPRLVIRNDDPTPFTCLALVPDVQVAA